MPVERLEYHEEVLLGMRAAELIEARFPTEKQLVRLAELQKNLVPTRMPIAQLTWWDSLKTLLKKKVW